MLVLKSRRPRKSLSKYSFFITPSNFGKFFGFKASLTFSSLANILSSSKLRTIGITKNVCTFLLLSSSSVLNHFDGVILLMEPSMYKIFLCGKIAFLLDTEIDPLLK